MKIILDIRWLTIIVFFFSFQSMYVSLETWNMHCKSKNNNIFLFIHKKCFSPFYTNQHLKLLYFLNLNCIYEIKKKLNIFSYDMSIFLLTIFFVREKNKTLLWSIQMTSTNNMLSIFQYFTSYFILNILVNVQ